MVSWEELQKRKNMVLYQMNAVKPYMTVDGHDQMLKEEWDHLQRELQDLQAKLQAVECQLAPLNKRKKEIQYLMNSIEKYMTVDGHDEFLATEWDQLIKELQKIQSSIESISLDDAI